MRSSMVVIVLIALMGAALSAAPKLQVEPVVYKFGEVTEGIVVQATFTLTNVGDATLLFPRQPHTTCGCTSAPLPKEELAPGESMKLVVFFDSTGFGGRRITRKVDLYSNDPDRPQRVLILEGYVREALPHEASASTLYYGFFLLVDLRSPEDYARGHLLGAVNIPLEELDSWLDRLPRSIPIYLYDATGAGAVEAARILREHGAVVSRAIAGGLIGWWEEVGGAFYVPADGRAGPPSGEARYGLRTVSPRRVVRNYYVLVDLRSPEEFAAGHIPGAINLSPEEVFGWLDTLPPVGEDLRLHIWLMDDDGTRSCELAARLRDEGYGNVYCLVGGLEQWRLRYGDELLWAEGAG